MHQKFNAREMMRGLVRAILRHSIRCMHEDLVILVLHAWASKSVPAELRIADLETFPLSIGNILNVRSIKCSPLECWRQSCDSPAGSRGSSKLANCGSEIVSPCVSRRDSAMCSRKILKLFALLAVAALFAVGTITAVVAQDADAGSSDAQPVVADEVGSLQGAVAAASGGGDAPADSGADPPPVPAVDAAADAAVEGPPDESGKMVADPAEIDARVQEAIESQERRDDVEPVMPIQLISSEEAAVLASGDGDVATTGAAAHFMRDVPPHWTLGVVGALHSASGQRRQSSLGRAAASAAINMQ